MKNKKGFTLVELLAVVVLLLIVALIAFPNFATLRDTSKNLYDNNVNVLLKNAASMYVNNHLTQVNNTLGSSTDTKYCLPIGTLIKQEYIDNSIKDSKGKEIKSEYCIIVKKKSLNPVEYEYTVPLEDNPEKASDYGITSY